MAQLERPQRPANTSKAQAPAPTIHTMEQLLRGEGSKLSPSYSSSSSSSPHSPSFMRLNRHHDGEEGQSQKKSVLTKVKEKAKKLRHSLSKKKHDDTNSTSPSSTALQDDGIEEDAEYLGAPVYESEKAPEGYKENLRQQPRGSPKTPEKHALSSHGKSGIKQDREKSLGRTMSKRTSQPAAAAAPAPAATTLPESKKIAEKLIPSNAEGSDAANSITSKIQGLAVSKPAEQHHSSSSTAATPNTSLSIAAPKSTPVKMHSHTQASSSAPRTSPASLTSITLSAPVSPPASSLSAPASGKNTSPTAQLWDKGVSVKEYLMNKFEPGEDEKALSRVISEAMSPRRTPGDAGVMEKVREAVTSLLRTEEPKKSADATPDTRTSSQTKVSNSSTARASSSQSQVSNNNTAHASSSHTQVSTNNTARASSCHTQLSTNNTARASSQLPVSTNAHEVAQEENRGRILQAN